MGKDPDLDPVRFRFGSKRGKGDRVSLVHGRSWVLRIVAMGLPIGAERSGQAGESIGELIGVGVASWCFGGCGCCCRGRRWWWVTVVSFHEEEGGRRRQRKTIEEEEEGRRRQNKRNKKKQKQNLTNTHTIQTQNTRTPLHELNYSYHPQTHTPEHRTPRQELVHEPPVMATIQLTISIGTNNTT